MTRSFRFGLLTLWTVIVAAAVPAALYGLVLGYRYVADYNRYVTATGGTVTTDVVAVASVNAGRVTRLRAPIGATVRAGEPLLEVELPAPVRQTTGGSPVLAFLGTAEQTVTVAAPVEGVVAAVLVAEGSAVAAGQPVIRLVEPSKLRVTAFVTQHDLPRLAVGQEAEVHLAATDEWLPGIVQSVVPASTGAFTPPTGVIDTKTGTRPLYPVYVRADLRDQPQLLGSLAEVRIRTR